MGITTTSLGCVVTTSFGKTSKPICGLPAGTEIEHVTLECVLGAQLRLAKPDREKNWDWNRR
jgi:hypothetical protein